MDQRHQNPTQSQEGGRCLSELWECGRREGESYTLRAQALCTSLVGFY